MFRTLLAKEFREQRRTSKLLILLVVFLISGAISPVLAKYTPALLRSIPDLPAGLADAIPEPTIYDAVIQYVKNVSQFGVLLVIVLTMGTVAQEKEHGTAAMLLTKPIRRSAVVLVKWLTGMGAVLMGLISSGIGCLVYTYLLFGELDWAGFLILNLLMLVFLGVYLTAALFASSLARTQSMAAAGAFGGLILLLILSNLPRVNEWMPGQLLSWGQAVVLGGDQSGWPALGIALSMIALALLFASLHFERAEI